MHTVDKLTIYLQPDRGNNLIAGAKLMSYEYTKSLFNEEHEIFRDSYRRFLETEADAHVDEWLAEGKVPQEFWLKAGEQGFLGVGVPEEYGGPGGDFLYPGFIRFVWISCIGRVCCCGSTCA